MQRFTKLTLAAWCSVCCSWLGAQAVAAETLSPRPPAVPLVTHTPYVSVWSRSETLTQRHMSHWTGQVQRLIGLIRVDGVSQRVIGPEPEAIPALEQTSVRVTPTCSTYEFAGGGIQLTLSFTSPMIATDLELVSRPVTYVDWTVKATDGKAHDVQLMLAVGAGFAAGEDDEPMVWSRETVPGLTALKIGAEAQSVLGRSGDRVRINWGYGWLATAADQTTGSAGARGALCSAFTSGGVLPLQVDTDMPRAANDHNPCLALVTDLGSVSSSKSVTQMIAYDEVKAMRYFGKPLNLWWARNGADLGQVLQTAAKEHDLIIKRCVDFDQKVTADAEKIGGPKYAYLCSLAYRQAMASSVLAADANGMPLYFNKEISSFGLATTVDVIYPMSPQILLFSPVLSKAMLIPVLDYTASDMWPFPYACHDIGMYPTPDGNVYGGMKPDNDPGRMPVEESANMLLMIAAAAYQQDGDVAYLKPYWQTLKQWADYLGEHGIDPVRQLSTDDFAGHLARNANLSVKAILGIGSLAWLCEQNGDTAGYQKYRKLAEAGVAQWLKLAEAGDHYTLVFEKPESWSLKYNLVWDKILGLNLFPDEVAEREVAFYLKKMNRFGVPLDSRQENTGMTKADWLVWSATLAGAKHFDDMVAPLYDFYNQVPQRNPMTDWYRTKDGQEIGFMARPVVGGVFIPFLYDRALWNKWANASDPMPKGAYAKLPKPPKIDQIIVPAGDTEPAMWRYVFSAPEGDWTAPDYNDNGWRSGLSGFGTRETPGTNVHTHWGTNEIWIRRTVTIPENVSKPIWLYVHHDEKATVYFNGQLAAELGGFVGSYQAKPLTNETAVRQLKPGSEVTIAIHCEQTIGGQYIDLGLVTMDFSEE